MDAKDTKSEQKDDQKIYNVNPNDNIYNNSSSNIPPPPPPRRENEGTLQTGTMYWMRIEDYATQIRIVALQARCGAAVSLEQIQKAHELALKMQEDLRPLLYAAQVPPNFSSNSPMFQNRPPVMNGVNSNWTDKPTYSPMKNTMSVFSNNTDSTMKMYPQQPLSAEASPKTIKRQKRKRQQDELERACKSCNTTETPEWRRGPLGPRTLCNACGLKWAKKVKAEKNRPEGSDFTEEEIPNTPSDQTNTTPPRPSSNPEFTQFIQTNTQNSASQSPNSQKPIQPGPIIFAKQTMPLPQAQLPQKFSVSLQPQSFHQHSMPLQHQMHLQSQNHSNSPPSIDRPQLPTGSLNQSPQPYLQTQPHLVQTQNEPLQGSNEKDQVGNISQTRTADGNQTESDEDRIDETMVDSHSDPQLQDVDIEDTQNDDHFVSHLENKIGGDETEDQTALRVDTQEDNLPPSPPHE